jgi:hypothetical protein
MLTGVIGSGVIENGLPGGGPLTLTFTYDTTKMGAGLALLPFVLFSGAAATAWWDYGDGGPVSQSAQPSHTYSTPGAYHVARYTDAAGPTNLGPGQGGFTEINILPLVSLLQINMGGQSLNQANVDGVLLALVANNLTGGTAILAVLGGVQPSATGLAAAAVLATRGWTVVHN